MNSFKRLIVPIALALIALNLAPAQNAIAGQTSHKMNTVINHKRAKKGGTLFLQIADNCKCSQATAEEAVRFVSQRKEIKEWLAAFTGPGGTGPTTSGSPFAVVEKKSGDIVTLHVYEDTPEHTVNFDTYKVNVKTGQIDGMFHDKNGNFHP